MYFFKYLTEGFTQKTLASGMNMFPRIQSMAFSINDCFFFCVMIPAPNFLVLFFDKKEAKAYGSKILFFRIIVESETSASNLSSSKG